MTNEISKLPWEADGYDIRQSRGRMIAYTGPHHTPENEYPRACKIEDEANARHIVRCVNLHDELVAALKLAKQLLDEKCWGGCDRGRYSKIDDADRYPVMDAIAAALAKAEAVSKETT